MSDPNSCPEGTDIWVPRSYNHAKAVWDAYSSYISFVGIYRPEDGCGSCTSYAMNSGTSQASHWRTVANSTGGPVEPWFMRAVPYSEPNGDYTPGCWLSARWNRGYDQHGLYFNDAHCNYGCACDGLELPTTDLPRLHVCC